MEKCNVTNASTSILFQIVAIFNSCFDHVARLFDGENSNVKFFCKY